MGRPKGSKNESKSYTKKIKPELKPVVKEELKEDKQPTVIAKKQEVIKPLPKIKKNYILLRAKQDVLFVGHYIYEGHGIKILDSNNTPRDRALIKKTDLFEVVEKLDHGKKILVLE